MKWSKLSLSDALLFTVFGGNDEFRGHGAGGPLEDLSPSVNGSAAQATPSALGHGKAEGAVHYIGRRWDVASASAALLKLIVAEACWLGTDVQALARQEGQSDAWIGPINWQSANRLLRGQSSSASGGHERGVQRGLMGLALAPNPPSRQS